MTKYTLRIYKRYHPRGTAGALVDLIELAAQDHEAAGAEGHSKIGVIDWDTYFAAVMSDDTSFAHFWFSR